MGFCEMKNKKTAGGYYGKGALFLLCFLCLFAINFQARRELVSVLLTFSNG